MKIDQLTPVKFAVSISIDLNKTPDEETIKNKLIYYVYLVQTLVWPESRLLHQVLAARPRV